MGDTEVDKLLDEHIHTSEPQQSVWDFCLSVKLCQVDFSKFDQPALNTDWQGNLKPQNYLHDAGMMILFKSFPAKGGLKLFWAKRVRFFFLFGLRAVWAAFLLVKASGLPKLG